MTDPYGGWDGLLFAPSGYFRLERKDNCWWLVTPDGNAFLANQMDHVTPHVLMADYNRAFWAEQFGISDSAPREDWLPEFREKVRRDQAAIGFNVIHGSISEDPRDSFVPYIMRLTNIDIAYWYKPEPADFKDVFSEEFVRQCEERASIVVANRKEDPYLLGWHFTDSPILSDFEAMPMAAGYYHKPLPGTVTYPQRLRNLGVDAPGKRAYVDLMRRRHRDMVSFNETYCTAFTSFDDLLAARDWKPRSDTLGNWREEADNHAFLLEILERAYTVQVSAVRKYDQNHLILGDRLNCNAPLDDDIIRLFGRHFDVLSFQFYGTWEDFSPLMERLHEVSGRPLHSADSCFSVANNNMPSPLGIVCANQRIRAEKFRECYQNSFGLPYFVGWGWCGWVDAWPSLEPHMQHSGVQDAFGRYDQPVVEEMKRFSDIMYRVHIGAG